MPFTRLILLTLLLPVLGSGQDVVKIARIAMPKSGEEQRTLSVRGVVTYQSIDHPWFILQDDTAGIVIVPETGATIPAVGSDITVKGIWSAGTYAPFLGSATWQIHGSAAMPKAVAATALQISRNAFFSRLVRLEAWVMDVQTLRDRVCLSLGTREDDCVADLPGSVTESVAREWFGAKVRITGVNWTEAASLRLHSATQIEIIERAQPPSAWPVIKAATWPKETDAPRLVTLRGQLVAPVIDGTWGMRCEGRTIRVNPLYVVRNAMSMKDSGLIPWPQDLKPGDEITMRGLLFNRDPVWDLGSARAVTPPVHGAPPASAVVAPRDVFNMEHWWDLITIEGRVRSEDTVNAFNRVVDALFLETDGVVYKVLMPRAAGKARPTFSNDRLHRVTGVCTPFNSNPRQNSFTIWTDNAHVEPLGLTPQAQTMWWRQALVVALTVLAGAAGWVFALRTRLRQQRIAQAAMTELNATLEQRVKERTAELEAAQTELSKALAAERELSKLKTNFVSMVSHEFRTPLGIISVNSELLNRYRERLKPEQMTDNLAGITNAVKRMSGMMENILLLSRVDSERLECNPTSLNLPGFLRRVADETLSATNGSHEIVLSIEGDGVEGDAQVDEAMLRHLLSNLITNACKYSPGAKVVEVTLRREGRDAVFIVRDHGIGIPEGDRERLFESFHRGGNVGTIAGTGLGLVIVKRCVDLHHGSLSVDSEEGKGTTFTVRLPLYTGEET